MFSCKLRDLLTSLTPLAHLWHVFLRRFPPQVWCWKFNDVKFFKSTRCWTTLKLTSNLPPGKWMKNENGLCFFFRKAQLTLPVFVSLRFVLGSFVLGRPFRRGRSRHWWAYKPGRAHSHSLIGLSGHPSMEGFCWGLEELPDSRQCLQTLFRQLYTCIHGLLGFKWLE